MLKLNKSLQISLVLVTIIALVAATIAGAIWVSHAETRQAEVAHPCPSRPAAIHHVDIQNDKVKPRHTDAKRCDELVITNLDDKQRYVAFGQHDHHMYYDGVEERYLGLSGVLKVRLIKTGDYRFHDHIDDKVAGSFSVR